MLWLPSPFSLIEGETYMGGSSHGQMWDFTEAHMQLRVSTLRLWF